MKTFTIENETNNITLHTSIQDAKAVPNAQPFRSEATLANIAAGWPASRLIDIWNSLPGQTPVKKFKDRATAVNRIWKALQILDVNAAEVPELASLQTEPVEEESPEENVAAPVAPQTPEVASGDVAPTDSATRTKKASAAAATKEAAAPRDGSKTSQVVAMLRREGGTTIEEIMAAMGWQKHTTRAMLSAGGSLTKNHGLVITSEKAGDRRVYSIRS